MRIWWKWYLMKLTLCPGNSQSLRTSLRFVLIFYFVLQIAVFVILIFFTFYTLVLQVTLILQTTHSWTTLVNICCTKDYHIFTWKFICCFLFYINVAIANSICRISWNFKTLQGTECWVVKSHQLKLLKWEFYNGWVVAHEMIELVI